MVSVSDIIAGLALIVSGISLYKSDRNTHIANLIARENVDLQERMLNIEQARETDRINQSLKASLVAEIIGHDPKYLRIENCGSAEAREVAVLVSGKPLLEHPRINKDLLLKTTNRISPYSCIKYHLFKTQGATTQEVSVSWEDNAGSHSTRANLFF